MPKKTEETKVPNTAGACADALYKLREQRHALGRKMAAIEAQEKAIRDHLIATLPADGATGVSGKKATVQIAATREPMVSDWEAFYAHVKKTGAFDLMQRRISPPAIRERWEADEQVPGIGTIVVKKVSVTKL